MSKRRGWLIALLAAGLAVIIAATAAYLFLPPQQTREVAAPPLDATPEQVVAAYLDALNAHDCSMAAALMTKRAEDRARSWCEDVASLTDIVIHDHVMELPEYTGHSPTDEVANVQVDFDLAWRPFHDDGSMDEGATTWGYLLVRDTADAPWRIFDQGMG